MELGLEGKTALITGASQGIGLACARALAAEGCHVHLAARNRDAMAAAKTEIEAAHGVSVHVHALDLSSTAAMERLAAEAPDIDILVNNAGDIPGGPLTAVMDAALRAGFDLKLFGYITLTRLYFERMRGRGGVVVNIIGSAGESWDANYFAGSTANAGLMSFTKAVGSTSLNDGIRVVGINPGPVSTARMTKLLKRRAIDTLGDESRWEELLETHPGKRPSTAVEVADLATFLASPRAGHISGTIVTIDGGRAARKN